MQNKDDYHQNVSTNTPNELVTSAKGTRNRLLNLAKPFIFLRILYLYAQLMKLVYMNLTITFRSILLLVLLTLLLTSCSEALEENDLPNLELLDPSITGIDFSNTLDDDPEGTRNLLSFPYYYNGAGVAAGDFDNDGLVDLFFAGNEVDNRIYKNLGDFKFEDLSKTAQINVNKTWSSGVSVIDLNNDNLLDIYVSQCGPTTDPSKRKNLLYINKGNFEFEESAEKMGLADGNIGTQAAFIDYDKDGDLDVYLMNESKFESVIFAKIFEELKDKNTLRENSGRFFRNNGNNTFTDVTEEAGLLAHSFGLGISVSDFNNDNFPDLYVANDYSVPDKLYINQQDGTFKDEIKKYTNSISFFSMGCDVGDINNDGFQDIAVVDMATADHFRGKTLMASMDSDAFNYYTRKLDYQYQYMFNSLQLNNGNGSYSNIAGYTGLQKTDWSWAALLVDMNLDGKKDYFVSNGYKKYARDNDFKLYLADLRKENGGVIPISLREKVYKRMPSVELRNLLYINRGDLAFDENPDDFNYPDIGSYSYGTVYADLDNDGDLELIVNNIDKPAHILKNNSREKGLGNSLTIKLKHPDNSAMTSQAKVKISYNEEIQIGENSFTRGYLSTMDPRIFFGVGNAKNIDKIEVLWPDNTLQVLNDVKTNQEIEVLYKAGSKGSLEIERPAFTQVQEINPTELGISYKHEENPYEDFALEVLLPQRQSTLGPALQVGDVNQDGLDDIFCGGATGQISSFYMQNSDGKFTVTDDTYFNLDQLTEDLDVAFVDPNKDGFKELFIASGGGGDLAGQNALLQDRFYALSSKGYSKVKGVAPDLSYSSGKLVTGDIDGDEIEEILVCGAATPGKYPLSDPTVLLKYKNNSYNDVSSSIIPELKNVKLARDGVFSDLNGDDKIDLIVVSEWGKPTVFIQGQDGKFTDETDSYISDEKFGWWASIEAVDIDNDGDDDYIIGNMGENIKHAVSKKKPLYLYANDFDKNGSLDVVLAKEYKGEIVPARGRECSSEQMPFIAKKFESYTDFANANIEDILGEKSVEEAQKYQATTFGSYILRNNGGTLSYEKLPALAQIAPISSSVIYDYNKDGYMDIIIAGNYYDTEYETPRQDAGRGLVLINNGGKSFEAVPSWVSGLDLNGNFRHISLLKRKDDTLLVAIENNGPLKIYKLP